MNRSTVIRSLCLAGAAALGIAANSAQAAVQQQLSVYTDAGAREYILATPAQPVSGPRPLVILLHGHIGTHGTSEWYGVFCRFSAFPYTA